ncbi:MAG: hypothetical protein ABSB12_01825 [Candidatus Saccharimonadales bacterium]
MRGFRKISPLFRAIGVISAVTAVVTGITFAQLSGSATLTGTSIDSASGGLNIWNGTTYASTAPGFAITGLIPGTGVTENVYLQNSGGVPEAITATIPTTPTSSGFSGWQNAIVNITAENTSCSDPSGFVQNTANATSSGSPYTVNTDIEDLMSGEVTLPCIMKAGDAGNSGVTGTSGNYDFHFDIAPTSITGSGPASIGPFNLDFTGTQVL